MSVLLVIVYIRIPSLTFVGLFIAKIWLIFGHGIRRPVTF